jgi:hypothetical protein
VEIGGSKLEARMGKKLARPYLKNEPNSKRAGDVTQMAEHLPSKFKDPIWIPKNPSLMLPWEVHWRCS